MSWRGYLKLYFSLVALGLFTIGAVNLMVDPRAHVRFVEAPGFNAAKVELRTRSRQAKSLALRSCVYDTVILGTSRSETGLDPSDPRLPAGRTYNASLAGTNMFELKRVADYLRRHQRPRTVILGLDFLTFSARRATSADFADSWFAGGIRPYPLLKYLLSSITLRESLKTLRMNLGGNHAECETDGHNDMSDTPIDHRDAFTEILQRNFFVNPETYSSFVYGRDRLDMLEAMLRDFSSDGARVHAFSLRCTPDSWRPFA